MWRGKKYHAVPQAEMLTGLRCASIRVTARGVWQAGKTATSRPETARKHQDVQRWARTLQWEVSTS